MKWCISPTSLTLSCVLVSLFSAQASHAQISSDGTLPTPTQVTPDNLNFTIDGGTQAGDNLFHSFREFSVPTGGEAFFNNAVDVQHIFSRVTGGNLSNIDGLIRANGTANLFLLNPAGIVFGPNARLDIGGSFFGSTADSIVFQDEIVFSATDSNPQPLLTINVPVGLQFGAAPGDISVEGNGVNRPQAPSEDPTFQEFGQRELEFQQVLFNNPFDDDFPGLRVQSGKTLGLVGGNLMLSGALLRAEQGRIELGSIGSNSRVKIAETGLTLDYTEVQNFQNIQLSEQSGVFASGEGAGNVQVQAQNLTLAGGSEITNDTLGSQPGGTVTVRTIDRVEISGVSPNEVGSRISTSTFGEGTAGELTVETGQLVLNGGGQIATIATGTENAGTVTVRASDFVHLLGTDSEGNPSLIAAVTGGTGKAGNIDIETGSLIVQDGGTIAVATDGDGDAGTLTIRASDSVQLLGTSSDGGPSILAAVTVGSGNAGNINIETGSLIVQHGAIIGVATTADGNAGEIAVRASELVNIVGTSEDGETNSSLLAGTAGIGNAGSITINTPQLNVLDGAAITVSTESTGMGGTIEIEDAESVELSRGGGIVAGTIAEGAAGNVEIDTDRFVAQDGGLVATLTTSSGPAGDININASESVKLTDSGSGLIAWTLGQGNAGTIKIDTEQFNLTDEAFVSVASLNLGEPGTIDIEANNIFQENQGSLLAFSLLGPGGNIQLEAEEARLEGLSGLLAFGLLTQEGNIDISSDRLFLLRDGSRVITLDADPEGGNITVGPRDESFLILFKCNSCIISASGTLLISDELPTPELAFTPILDVNSLIRDDVCEAGVGSEFIIPGAGGIPPSPLEPLPGSGVVALDWVEFLEESPETAAVPQPENEPSDEDFQLPQYKPLVEAQGWIVGENGQILLVAESPTVTPAAPALNRIDCHADE
ncbi:MAG: filamentous hemagglutinin N-terminal domain-containing protein [Geitlerinemataceae cyanobacterium]